MQAIRVDSQGGTSASLELVELPVPTLTEPFDILTRVPGKIVGWDASGVVEAAGPRALFKPGDFVYYCGEYDRPGCNSQLQLVDSRIVGRKPAKLSWEDAAAVPVIGITSWEMFVEKFRWAPHGDNGADTTLLIVNAAGGVGTMALLLASKVFSIKRIIATASRPETIDWVKKFGATDVLNHREPLGPQLEALQLNPSHALLCHDDTNYIAQLATHMRPAGHIGSIVNADSIPFGGSAMFRALTFSWGLTFSKSMFKYDLESQHRILNELADLVDDGTIPSMVTVRKEFGLQALREGHDLQESGRVYGKIAFTVLERWS
ncbi:GroES-like protein [Auriculariales sp. MPI-PUGE-AT-0066]|nr:GroES-like protein [Auriculariales sp. MPI-PUGE-AT-0066]